MNLMTNTEEIMNILVPNEISDSSTTEARRLDNIHRQEKVKRKLISEISICNGELDKHFKILGQHLSQCLFNDDKTDSDNIDTDKHLAFILSNQKAIDACKSLLEVIEDELILNIIDKEKIDHEHGIEVAKIKLQEELSKSEIGELEHEFKLFLANSWFKNYDKITETRLQKADKLISWEEMETRINNLLKINYD